MKNKILVILLVLVSFTWASAQKPNNTLYEGGSPAIPKPVFGQYTVGDDYFLANYQQYISYIAELEKISDRIILQDAGVTTEGRPYRLAIISSPDNLKNLEEYRQISVKLAKAEHLTDDEARQFAAKGKAIVWIDGGLHATETLNAQALFTLIYDMLARNDEEVKRILDNVILLVVASNPDGMDLVSDWYMRESRQTKRKMNIPYLYQKYAGHDNNRDSYMANLTEIEILNRLMFIEWIPQIVYNQHQSSPEGTTIFVSPTRDPVNYNQDPLTQIGIELFGTTIHRRFLTEGKAGAVKREAASFSTWYGGGVRNAAGLHNQIALLHEIRGRPTPISIPVVTKFLLPVSSNPMPIGPQQSWHQCQSLEYVISANRAVLDLAARQKDEILYGIYRAGKNSIERGSRDHWTVTPKWINKLKDDIAAYKKKNRKSANSDNENKATGKLYNQLFTPENRDPRGYIVPANQIDFLTATKFIHALQKAGIDVYRATSNFTVAGKTYPEGSYVVKTAQAFRPHLRDMFEPQDYPDEFKYSGGPPIKPYDAAGWTLAFQMGVQFDRMLDNFDGPFEKIEGLAKTPTGKITGVSNPEGYLLSHQLNDAFVATTNLLAAGEEVYWLQEPLTIGGKAYAGGTSCIPAKKSTAIQIQKLVKETGLNFDAVASNPKGDALKLRKVKVALWDKYGGSMASGWIRLILERLFPFPSFEVVYPQTLDAGNLRSKYDAIILPPGAFSMKTKADGATSSVPTEFKHMTGEVTLNKTAPELRKFVEEGVTILAIGSSVDFGKYLGLPIKEALVKTQSDGTEKPLSSDQYFVPSSVLCVRVDNTIPIAYGVSEDLDLIFDNNPVFWLSPEAGDKGVRTIADFPNTEPLRSGWAWGQRYLKGGTLMIAAKVGKGNVFLFGSEITFRAQSHASFKFLFNGIYYSGVTAVKL